MLSLTTLHSILNSMVLHMGIAYKFNRKLCNHFIQLSVKELENKSGFWEVGLF